MPMIRIVNSTTAETAMTPTPASTIIAGIRLLALVVIGVVWDGDSAVFERTEGSGGDVVAAACLAGGDRELCGDNVDFGALCRPVGSGRERVYDGIDRGRNFRAGFQVVR